MSIKLAPGHRAGGPLDRQRAAAQIVVADAELQKADLAGSDLSGLDLEGRRSARRCPEQDQPGRGRSYRGAAARQRPSDADLDRRQPDLCRSGRRQHRAREAPRHQDRRAENPQSRRGSGELRRRGGRLARASVGGGAGLAGRAFRSRNQGPARSALRRGGAPAPRAHAGLEMPPNFVAGGTWTACYHLVRKLRQRGANVTLVAPWRRDEIADTPFGIDVPIVGLDIVPPAQDPSPYGAAGGRLTAHPLLMAAAGLIRRPSSIRPTAPMRARPRRTGRLTAKPPRPTGATRRIPPPPAPPCTGAWANSAAGSGTISPITASISFTPTTGSRSTPRALLRRRRARPGSRISTPPKRSGSTKRESPLTMRIEQIAVDDATLLIAPSKITAARPKRDYGASPGKLQAVPTLMS